VVFIILAQQMTRTSGWRSLTFSPHAKLSLALRIFTLQQHIIRVVHSDSEIVEAFTRAIYEERDASGTAVIPFTDSFDGQ
jgi:hypothetical protein